MKLFLGSLILFCHLSAYARITDHQEEAIIQSIDSLDTSLNYVEASEAAIPEDLYALLMKQMVIFQFTLMEESAAEELFTKLETDPQARNKEPGGKCAIRRAYIQKLLKKSEIVSGQLYIKCPLNDGILRLKDQVSGSYYSFTNYHDSNIVAVKTSSGVEFRVMDLQFEDLPVSLSAYVGEVEASQKVILPLKTRGNEDSRGKCYWSISTEHLTF